MEFSVDATTRRYFDAPAVGASPQASARLGIRKNPQPESKSDTRAQGRALHSILLARCIGVAGSSPAQAGTPMNRTPGDLGAAHELAVAAEYQIRAAGCRYSLGYKRQSAAL